VSYDEASQKKLWAISEEFTRAVRLVAPPERSSHAAA
jgi:hypothetical protein